MTTSSPLMSSWPLPQKTSHSNGKRPAFIRHDADACHLARIDVGADTKLAELEPVVAVE